MRIKHWLIAIATAMGVLAAPAAQAQSIERDGNTYVAAPVNSGEAHRWAVMHRNNNRDNPFDKQCRDHATTLQVNLDALCGDIKAADLVPAVRSNGYLYDSMTVNGGRVQGTTLYALGRDVVTYSTSVEVGDYLYVIDYYRGPDGCFNVAVKRYRKVTVTFSVPPPPPPVVYQQPQPRTLQTYRQGYTVGGQTFYDCCCNRGFTTGTITLGGQTSTQTFYF